MSSGSGFVNGEVVTIDGGELNWFTELPNEQIDATFEQLWERTRKK